MALPITSGKRLGPQHAVIYGPEGIGKSTLAAAFPNPVFIDTENSTAHMDVARAPKPTSWAMLLKIVSELKTDQQGFTTCVIDTVDWAERLCVEYLCGKHGVDGIEGMGYGKGYTYLAEEFGRFLNALSELPMHVVLTAHAATRRFELPEETGAYDRWELKLQKKTAPMIKEWADVVLFCNYQIYVVKDEKTQHNKAQGGERVMYTSHHPCFDAKNRHDLAHKLKMEFSEIAQCFPLPGNKPPAPAPAPPAPQGNTVEPPALSTEQRKVRDLMDQDGVSLGDLMGAIAKRGWFPLETPFENLPADFLNKAILGNWPKVVQSIKGETSNV